MHAQIVSLRLRDATAAGQDFERHAVPELEQAPGFVRAELLGQPATGAGAAVVYWTDEASAARFGAFPDGGGAWSRAEAPGKGAAGQAAPYEVLWQGKPVTERRNEALVRRANDAFSRKDLETLLACYADDAVQYEPFIEEPIRGKDALRDYFTGSFAYFPDETITIHRLLSTGDYVTGQWQCRGTHSGDFLGMAPTGRRFDVPEAAIYEIRDGLVQNLWVFVDSGTIARQFGYGWSATGD